MKKGRKNKRQKKHVAKTKKKAELVKMPHYS